jgi:hypothetical protein
VRWRLVFNAGAPSPPSLACGTQAACGSPSPLQWLKSSMERSPLACATARSSGVPATRAPVACGVQPGTPIFSWSPTNCTLAMIHHTRAPLLNIKAKTQGSCYNEAHKQLAQQSSQTSLIYERYRAQPLQCCISSVRSAHCLAAPSPAAKPLCSLQLAGASTRCYSALRQAGCCARRSNRNLRKRRKALSSSADAWRNPMTAEPQRDAPWLGRRIPQLVPSHSVLAHQITAVLAGEQHPADQCPPPGPKVPGAPSARRGARRGGGGGRAAAGRAGPGAPRGEGGRRARGPGAGRPAGARSPSVWHASSCAHS